MAMAVGTVGGMKSDINITPFIDVLLVLLVIFMITQPMLRKVLEIQVPREEQSPTQQPSTSIVIVINEDGALAINTQPVTMDALLAKFHEIYDNRAEKLLFIKVSNLRPYKDVIDVIDVARGAGVKVFGLAPPTAEEAAAAATRS